MGLQAHSGRTLRQRHLIDFTRQLEKGVKEALGPGRPADDVNIHGHDAIHTSQTRVRMDRTAGARARAHRNTPLGIGHLLPDALEHGAYLQRDRAGDDHQGGLPRRGPKNFRAETGDIEARRRGGDHFDGAAGQSERERPDGGLASPVEDVVHRRNHEVLFEALVENAHGLRLPPKARQYSSGATGSQKRWGARRSVALPNYLTAHQYWMGFRSWVISTHRSRISRVPFRRLKRPVLVTLIQRTNTKVESSRRPLPRSLPLRV